LRVIVCGAGQVGFNIARYLAAEDNDVVVIDTNAELVRRVGDTLDVQALQGYAAHPDVLDRAGANAAELIIAVTYNDEVNMVACQVAHSLFNVPKKIARVRAQNYFAPDWAGLFTRDNMPIDVIISPEIEVARAIMRRLEVPGAFDSTPMADGKIRIIGVRCDANCPVLDTPLRQLVAIFPDLHIVVVAIVRNGAVLLPSGDDRMLAGDEVYFVADSTHVSRAMAAFGHEELALRRVIIAGGGNIGLNFAQALESANTGVHSKIIEANRDRATEIARLLKRTTVLNGSALDPEILEEANVGAAEAIVAVTNDDETNILSSLLAKRHGAGKAFTLVNNLNYAQLVSTLGVDAVVSPRLITVSTILQHVRRGRIRAVHPLSEGVGEILEVEALETCGLIGTPLRDAPLPNGVHIGALVRDGKVVMARGGTVIRPKDCVVLFATTAAVKEAEKLFAVRLEFF